MLPLRSRAVILSRKAASESVARTRSCWLPCVRPDCIVRVFRQLPEHFLKRDSDLEMTLHYDVVSGKGAEELVTLTAFQFAGLKSY